MRLGHRMVTVAWAVLLGVAGTTALEPAAAAPGAGLLDAPPDDAGPGVRVSVLDLSAVPAAGAPSPSAAASTTPFSDTAPQHPGAEVVVTTPQETASFGVLGFTWSPTPGADRAVIRFRVRDAGAWSAWQEVGAAEGAVEAGQVDARQAAGHRVASDPVVVGSADGLQVWVPPVEAGAATAGTGTGAGAAGGTGPSTVAVEQLKAVLVDPGSRATDAAVAAAVPVAGAPAIIDRAAWGADESRVSCSPEYTSELAAAAIHHTVSSNTYAAQDVPGILRGIQAFHSLPEEAGGRGWCDVGYNFFVDRFGRVFEGRGGGVDKPVIGVHTGGFNSRVVGIALVGNHDATVPSAQATEAVSRLVAWKFAMHRIRGQADVVLVSGGGASRYPAGTPVRLPTVFGHRDAQATTCPGQRLYDQLGNIRARVAALADAGVAVSPFGAVDAVSGTSGGVQVAGWAIDPGTAAPIAVHAYVDGVGTPLIADGDRPDVGRAFPGSGSRHGFAAVVPAPPGTAVVCLYAINVGDGANTTLGCRRVTVPASHPVGHLDSATPRPGRVVRVAGWAVDPNTRDPLTVHLYVDGRGAGVVTADRSRPDVAAALRTGPNHGFVADVVVAAGARTVCAYGINVGPGSNTLLGCRRADVVDLAPVGAVDSVERTAAGLRVTGWTLDPDVTRPVPVHIYVDGRGVAVATAARSRPDVAAAWGRGDQHGFVVDVPAAAGRHTVCAYGIDVTGGSNALVGCRTVTV